MKNYLKTLIVFLLVLCFALALVGCGKEKEEGGSKDKPVEPPPPVDEEDDYRIKFVYSYTALVTNQNGREDYKDEEVTVDSIFVSENNNGFTDAMINEIANMQYNGYTFVKWYTRWDKETQTGIESSLVDFKDFGKIDGDITLYGDRGDLAGADATWKVEFFDNAGNVIPVETVDANKAGNTIKEGILTISGKGAMFNFANANAIDLPWYNYNTKITQIVVEEGITVIGTNAFSGFTKLKSVQLPNSLVEIGASAFANSAAKSWRTLELPPNVKVVGSSAFAQTSFKEVVLNEGLEILKDSAFYGSKSIKTIVVPKSLKEIGIGAFHEGGTGTHALSKVYYHGTAEDYANLVIQMDNQNFVDFPTTYFYTDDATVGNSGAYWHYVEGMNAEGATVKVPVQYCYTVNYFMPGEKVSFVSQFIPVSPVKDPVTGEIETDADGIPKLEGVITEKVLEVRNNLTYHNMTFVGFKQVGSAPATLNLGDAITADISYTVDRGNILSDGGGIIWSYDEGSKTLTVSKNPNAPEGASYRMWDFVDALDTGVLWTGSFNGLNGIKTLIIGDGVEYIGNLAFANLTAITEVVLPESVVEISPTAFSTCGSLLSIYCMSDDPMSCKGLLNEDGTLALVDTFPTVYARTETAVATPGNYWMEIEENGMTKRICWSLVATEIEPGKYGYGSLSIGGDNEMINFKHPELAPWYGAKDYIVEVLFNKNIISLGENVLNGYDKVTYISLPAALRTVPASSLAGTGVVNDINGYNKGLLVINGVLVKADPSKLNIELVETYVGVNVIASGAFDRFDAIKRIYIAPTVQSINPDAFGNCDIETVYFEGEPEGWAAISANAGFSADCKVLYKATSMPTADASKYWNKVGNEYLVWGCDHKWTEWTVIEESNCIKQGSETRHCIYDATHVETRDLPLSDVHNVEGATWTHNTDATCDANATEIAHCIFNPLCKGTVVREVEGTQLEHVFTNYYYQGDGTCLKDGTMTAFCDLCKNASHTVVDPDHISTGSHTWGDYIYNEDATCCEDGTETRTCKVCFEEEDRTAVGSAELTAHKYTVKTESQMYYAGESEDGNSLYFFVSCEWCGIKGPYKFSKTILTFDTIDDKKLPSGFTSSTALSDKVVDGDSVKLSIRIAEEKVGEAVNYFIKYKELNSTSQNNMTFSQSLVDGVDTYYYQHDFRWWGASDVRGGNWPLTIKMVGTTKDGPNKEVDTGTFNIYAKEGEDVASIGSSATLKNLKNGEWVTLLYKVVKNDPTAEYSTWTITLYVNGTQASKLTTRTDRLCSTVPSVKYEARYTTATEAQCSNQEFDFDNVANYPAPSFDYKLNVCEGEHNMGDWIYNEDASCTTNGTKSRVCLAEGCNYVETEDDELYPQLKHEWVDATEENPDGYVVVDATCTEDGYYKRVCSLCEEVETVYDMDEVEGVDYPKLGHKWVDATEENAEGYVVVDATCSADGYYKRVCSVCEFEETVYDMDENGENDFPKDPDAHVWADATEENPEGYVLVGATCTEDGYYKRVCSLCEEVETVYDMDEVEGVDYPKLGHTWTDATEENPDGYVIVNATCTEDGYYKRVCSVCEVEEIVYDMDENEENDFPKNPEAHVWADATEENPEGYVLVGATCTEDGYYKRVCSLCEEVETVYDLDEVEGVDNPKLGHKWADATEENPDGYVIVNATCTEDGYYKRVCSVCELEEIVYDMDENEENDIPATGHEYGAYIYNGDRDCVTDGTESAYCNNCDHIDTRKKAGYEALGHKLTPPTFIPGTATCQHGSETTASCTRSGCDYEETSFGDDVLDYHSFTETIEDKYFAGYSEDNSAINYYVSCAWCGEKGMETFSENIINKHDFSEGKLPSYVTPPSTLVGATEVPTTGGGYAALINNEWYATGKNSGGEIFTRFNLSAKDNTTEIFEFDFKFDGATVKDGGSTGQWFGIVKFFDSNSKETIGNRAMNYADVANQKMRWDGVGGAIYNKGEWHTIRFEFTHKDGVTSLVTYVDGTQTGDPVKSNLGVVKQFAIHTRGSGYYTAAHFGFKNFAYGVIDQNSSLENVQCADGEHTFGKYVYNKDKSCTVDGTKSAICQNGTCNYIDTVVDEENPMIGSHDYGEYTYNNDQACEVAGTKSATCARCGDVNTIADEEHPALEHSFLDYADVADSATCQHGSKSVAICENGCGKEDVKYSDDVLECVFEEIVAPKNLMTPADYENAAVYYKSCKWCGEFEKNGEDYVTFSFGEALVDKFADGELLVGLNVNKFETDQPASGKFNERITSEVVDDATNYFLRAEKIAAGGSNYVRFTTELVEGATEYVYEFKFRWGGTTAQPSDGGAMMFKLMKDCSKSDDSNRLAFLGYGNSSAVGADLSIGGATAAVNTWVNFKCVIKLTEDGKWATTITVNDTVAFTATVSNTSVPVFMLETRYANTYSMYFDVDDVVVYAK